MALPSSGNLSFSQILTEFSAPIGTKLSQLHRGDAYVPDTAANAGVPASGPIAIRDFLGASAALPLSINVTNHSIVAVEPAETNPVPPPAIVYGMAKAAIFVRNDGILRATYTLADGSTVTADFAGEWRAAGVSADYDVRATLVSGSIDVGAIGPWQNCGATREWNVQHSSAGSQSGTIKLEFRPAGGGAVLDSCNITLTAQR